MGKLEEAKNGFLSFDLYLNFFTTFSAAKQWRTFILHMPTVGCNFLLSILSNYWLPVCELFAEEEWKLWLSPPIPWERQYPFFLFSNFSRSASMQQDLNKEQAPGFAKWPNTAPIQLRMCCLLFSNVEFIIDFVERVRNRSNVAN